MKVIIDDCVPFIRETAKRIFDEVVFLPGSRIGAQEVRDADALIVRTRTKCGRELLEGSRVQFIATATIGFDHLDTEYLRTAGIRWANCPGCNASSVAQYVENCLIVLRRMGLPALQKARPKVGIVGVGHVGQQVALRLQDTCHLLLNDPPRQRAEDLHNFVSLEELAETCDVITFHTPLTRRGTDKTFHLADTDFFHRLKQRPLLINAARGGVVEEEALLAAMDEGLVGGAVVDTWENEPHANPLLLQKALIATPHIAGYSADGKANASRMALEAVCKHFGLPADFRIAPPALPAGLKIPQDAEAQKLLLYNPLRDSEALKDAPQDFERLRGNYPLRREFF